jgi:hypothetical protein
MGGLLAALIVAATLADEPPPGVAPALVVEPEATNANEPPPAPSPVPVAAALPPQPRFGDAGEIVIEGALSASFGLLGYSSGGSSTTSFAIEPAFDHFSSRNLSEGASAFFRYSDSVSGIDLEEKNETFGVTGHLALNLWLGDRVSLWPRLAVGVWQSRTTYFVPLGTFNVSVDGTAFPISNGTQIKENAVFVELYAPFLFHLAPHFFIGIGPEAYADVLHSANSIANRRMFVGAESLVGGWF